MKKLFGLLLLTVFALTAGELTGKWTGKFDMTTSDGEDRSGSAYMGLKLDGTTVTGTAGPDESKQWPIKNGKLADHKLTFTVETDEGGLIDFDLVFDGDTIRGNANGTGNGGEKMSAKLDLKRVN
ncbi:MAG: hypothetical protein ABSF22_00325 [Bryobacteraceae bacterium]